MQSLLDWTAAPDAAPSPLPSLSSVRRGAFPVALLPWHAIARDLAAFGVRYSRRTGFVGFGGLKLSAADVARTLSVVLHSAADALHTQELPSEVLARQAAEQAAELDRLQAQAHRERPDDYEAAEELAAAYGIGLTVRAPASRARADSAEVLAADRHALALGARYKDHAAALRKAADSVKAYPTPQRLALQHLRAELLPPVEEAPAPTPTPEPAAESLPAFLASHDGEPKLDRAALWRSYSGAASRPELFASASARWGSARKVRGRWFYDSTLTKGNTQA